jgi:hypothetical protein
LGTRLIDDLIILGRACPEPIKDGRITVCLGGYSQALGFVRIYPTRTDMAWKQWDIVRVEVEKDDRDTREESWKIAGSRTEWDNLSGKIEIVDNFPRGKWRDLIANLVDNCVQDINEAHRSLGIVKPNIVRRYFADNPLYGQMFQGVLPGFGEPTKVKHDFPVEPRVVYRCSVCKTQNPHDQQVLEWGFYEWIRKNPDNINQVWKNALIDSPKHDIYFFVGNQFKHRTSFVVISILRVPKGPTQPPLVPYAKRAKE